MFQIYKPNHIRTLNVTISRNFWHWLTIVFNSLDKDRRNLLGSDRTCAEWLLRNGAAVKWTTDEKFLRDYNALPSEDIKLFIKEVDATESSIHHSGFAHFIGCKFIDKIILHKCSYLENEALPHLKALSETLKFLQITSCHNVGVRGLSSLSNLSNLNVLILGDLPYLDDKEKIVNTLRRELPKCEITYK